MEKFIVVAGNIGSGKTTLLEQLLISRVPRYRGEKESAERAAALFLTSFVTGNAWWIIAIYSAVLSLISFLTTFVTPETKGRSLTDLNDAGQETVHA